tara:strand:+ start:71 stop:235 length:165 start_codon:yes stop_codon:yes gene_type:complete
MSKSKQDDRQEDRTVKFTDYAVDKYQFMLYTKILSNINRKIKRLLNVTSKVAHD